MVAEAKFGEDLFGGEVMFVPRCEKEEDMEGRAYEPVLQYSRGP